MYGWCCATTLKEYATGFRYLLGDVCGGGRRREAQLVEGVEAKRVDVALLGEHHRVVLGRCHLGAVVRLQALHHARNLGGQTGGWSGAGHVYIRVKEY